MPRVRVSLPDELLQRAAAGAEELGKHIDELYAEAIGRYVEVRRRPEPGPRPAQWGVAPEGICLNPS